MKKSIFKRWWFWAIVIVVIVGVIGSSGNGDTATTSVPDNSAKPIVNTPVKEEKKPDLEVLESSFVRDEYSGKITGKIKNNTNKQYSYVQVEINLYDDSGAQVGSTLANINNLEANGIWNFEAMVLEKAATKYKIKDITKF